jgi:hypothetical protein
MGVAADEAVVLIGQVQISGYEPRRQSKRTQGCNHQHREIAAGFQHRLVAVVARTQHHAVLAERDRLAVMIGPDVPDSENRHCSPSDLAA